MRSKRLLWWVLWLCPLVGLAQVNLRVSGGTACLVNDPEGIDYVYLFRDIAEAELTTQDLNPSWYRLEGRDSVLVATGVDYIRPEDNTGYILHTASGRCTFYTLSYAPYRGQLVSLEVDESFEDACAQTRLVLSAPHMPTMSYRTPLGRVVPIERICTIQYQSLMWAEEWTDSLCLSSQPYNTSFLVDAPLQNTTFTLFLDQFAAELGLPQDSITSPLYEAKAVATYPITTTTIRGEGSETLITNEVDRPTDASVLQGSAPLEILFEANGTPLVQHYEWRLYRGTTLIAQRTDKAHRYVFDTFGEYRIVLNANGEFCAVDSTVINVSVRASQLLVPNVFTPNGDGKNDEFRVMYRSIVEFQCWVYNRWGKLVYSWSDPAKGWNGTINGKPAAESAYFYVIRAKGADDFVYKLKGDINLIRNDAHRNR